MPTRSKHHAQQLNQPLIAGSVISYEHSHELDTCNDLNLGSARRRGRMGWFGGLFCCGGRSGRPKREHSRRRHRRKHGQAASIRQQPLRNELGGVASSVVSDSEYHDAREVFSVGEGDNSPISSAQVSPRAGSFEQYHDDAYHEPGGESFDGSMSESGSETSQSSTGFGARLVSCLSIMRASSPGEMHPFPEGHSRTPGSHAKGLLKPLVGCTFERRSPAVDPGVATLCWDECETSNFQIRSRDYMSSKAKQPSSKAIYRLVAMDLFSTESKAFHVAKMFTLPPTGPPVVCKSAVGGGPEVVLPPLLIMNVQLPDYPAAFWGANDGQGQSIVYYFQLRDDFDPETFENQAALGLLQRFVSNGREADGSPTRDRLKMIVRVANLDEWARVAPLNGTEYKLLLNYNEKPVLTRPQQAFYVGPNYLEVDLDVHSYAFLARKALWSYHDRISTVVWDNGFVIQGNTPDELPEQLLGCGRIYRSDFRQFGFAPDAYTTTQASMCATPSGRQTAADAISSSNVLPSPSSGDSAAVTVAGADAAVLVNGVADTATVAEPSVGASYAGVDSADASSVVEFHDAVESAGSSSPTGSMAASDAAAQAAATAAGEAAWSPARHARQQQRASCTSSTATTSGRRMSSGQRQ